MKREFTTVTRVFRLFADIFDLNAILTKLRNETWDTLYFEFSRLKWLLKSVSRCHVTTTNA